MDDVELIYLEADDEVTSVVRRLRDAGAPRVVIVAPGRSRATSSAVALRLLARFGAETGREVAVVGDALTRSLAADAGLRAYMSVEDARVAAPIDVAAGGANPRRAGIQVVRGTGTREAAPTMAAAALGDPDAASAETRPLGTVRPVPVAPRRASPRRARRLPIAVPAALLALLLAAGVVAGAVLVPAAEVTLELRSVAVPAQTYSIEVAGARRASGTIEQTGTVTASGTYPILTQAGGEVTLFNYSGAPVDVEPGTLVATGQEPGAQAFSTVTPVVVPKGTLLADGRIQGGEATVPVMAFAGGPGGNVDAGAIDTVLSEGPRNRLRAFADERAPLVMNAGPTTDGTESTGPLILQEDVDAAVAALELALADSLAEELGQDDLVAVPIGDPPAPVIEGVEGLVGTQDVETAPINGTQAYDGWLVDPDAIETAAAARLAADSEAVPPDHRLASEATTVRVVELSATTEGVTASAEVAGRAEAIVDEGTVIERIRGRTADDAERALEALGRVEVTTWPGWVASVPELEWRIDVRILSVEEPGGSPAPSASP